MEIENEEKITLGAIASPIVGGFLEGEIEKRKFSLAGIDGKDIFALAEILGGYYTYKNTGNPYVAGAGVGLVASGAKVLGESIAKKLFSKDSEAKASGRVDEVKGVYFSNTPHSQESSYSQGSQYYNTPVGEEKRKKIFTV